ncbi:MAG: hypothetical protein ACLQLC_13335 [Candidatus Sulfotelmatobacter sp.]
MSPNIRRIPSLTFLNLAQTKFFPVLPLWVTLFAAMSIAAQNPPPQTNPSTDPQTTASAAPASTVTIPAGARIALVLTQPVQTRYLHRGDDIYAQTVAPVTNGSDVVIPAGTFVQGKIDKLERHGGRGELRLQSLSITFPDGYTTSAAGPLMLESDDGYALKDPGKGRAAGAFAMPAAGLGIGALIGHAAANSEPQTITNTLPPGCTGPPPGCLSSSVTAPGSTAKGTVIGAMVGGAIGGVGALVLLVSSHDFFLDVGTPVQMVLQNPLTLQEDEVEAAIRDAEKEPAAQQPVAQKPQSAPAPKTNPGICYTPGTPGTPDVDIPGTPAIGDSPGTPSIHIPGTPGTPPIAHACP